MYTKVSILLALAAVASAAPQRFQPALPSSYRGAAIIAQTGEVNLDGSYTYSYQSDDGQSAQVRASTKNVGNEVAQSVDGQYSYVGTDGVQYTVTYVADEDGFRAAGAHLPTPPPIPDEIQRSLEFNARNPEPQSPQDRQAAPQSSQPTRPPFQQPRAAPVFSTSKPFGAFQPSRRF